MNASEVIILVGGLGTRLREAVPDLPKPLAPVAGRPFLAHLLDRFARAGLRRAILASGYRAEMIEDAIGMEWQGMQIVHSLETERLGTGGALRHAARLLTGHGAHVVNGDTWLAYDPIALERTTGERNAAIGMLVWRRSNQATASANSTRYAWLTTCDCAMPTPKIL